MNSSFAVWRDHDNPRQAIGRSFIGCQSGQCTRRDGHNGATHYVGALTPQGWAGALTPQGWIAFAAQCDTPPAGQPRGQHPCRQIDMSTAGRQRAGVEQCAVNEQPHQSMKLQEFIARDPG
jgi:hypothetical protein